MKLLYLNSVSSCVRALEILDLVPASCCHFPRYLIRSLWATWVRPFAASIHPWTTAWFSCPLVPCLTCNGSQCSPLKPKNNFSYFLPGLEATWISWATSFQAGGKRTLVTLDSMNSPGVSGYSTEFHWESQLAYCRWIFNVTLCWFIASIVAPLRKPSPQYRHLWCLTSVE